MRLSVLWKQRSVFNDRSQKAWGVKRATSPIDRTENVNHPQDCISSKPKLDRQFFNPLDYRFFFSKYLRHRARNYRRYRSGQCPHSRDKAVLGVF
ncbi:hypothetical protein AY599_18875 [Leptolyngbya valderiana BDU 20041]|nr:hypothetical protein AY599_18875 [Leptolyngbya valderiana BDU 20041]